MAVDNKDTQILLKNVAAQVCWDGPGRLRCEVSGAVVTVLLAAGAVLFLGMGAGAGVAGLALPFPDPRPLLGAGAMAGVSGVVFALLARGRAKKSGTYLLDGGTRRITRVVRGKLREQWSFDAVQRVETAVDLTDGTRLDLLPALPAWLVLVVEGGRKLRVAKGGKAELAGVERALGELGLGGDGWGRP